jgi:DNA repair ATPase RecN
MNARVIINHAATQQLAAPCPAEEIGHRIQQLEEQLAADDQAEGADVEPLSTERLRKREQQLLDLSRRYEADLEWVSATTVRGVFVQLQQLRSLADDLEDLDAGPERDRIRRSFNRLVTRAGDALIDIGEIGASELGRHARWRSGAAVAKPIDLAG